MYIRHGEYNTKLYNLWQSMKKRCRNNSAKTRRIYKDRGITYIKEWHNYLPFRDWALKNGYKDGLSLDRIDNDKGYEPSNCRFVTLAFQCIHRRPSREWNNSKIKLINEVQYLLPL